MRNRIFGLALVGAVLTAGAARAQTGEYAAPGFPMLPQRRSLPAPTKGESKLLSPVLPRFWHEPDAGKQAQGRTKFFEFVSEQAKFPAGARPTAEHPDAPLPTGRLFVRVLVRPDGSVRQPPRVTRRELARPGSDYPPAALRALDAEALRVLGALRFVRSKALEDSLVVPIRFIAE